MGFVRDALGRFASVDWTASIDADEWIWSAVSSSNVAAVGYNAGTHQLGVTFLNGSTYYYAGVPEEVYEALLHAGSVGKTLHAVVKGHYGYERVA